jgi:hypothetical protein
VEEELLEEFLHIDPKNAMLLGDFKISRTTEEVEELKMKEDKEGEQEATGKELYGMEVEGISVLAPPPITTILKPWKDPPPFFHPKQLSLVFELRIQMVDQIH